MREELLAKAPKIIRLKSKVCKIISDHEDVLDYDAHNYPPGTDKISKFIVLDVEQEKLQKQHTVYKSYAEIQICSSINRKQMWDDSVNIPWETFIQFFAIFSIKFDPVGFLKRGGFRREESFLINQFFTRCFYLDQNNAQELSLDMRRLDIKTVKYDEIFLKLPEHQEKPMAEVDELTGEVKNVVIVQRNSRQLFEKYIKNEEFVVKFDESQWDKQTFPFYDESDVAFDRLFQYGRKSEFKLWIQKFRDPEEQKDVEKLKIMPTNISGMGTTIPIYMVEEMTMQFIKQDPNHMFNLSLSKFNAGSEYPDLLYMGRLNLSAVLKYSKIEPYAKNMKIPYNVKIEYFVRGVVPYVEIKCFDTYTMDVLQMYTINQRHIKMIIRICNQQSDKMIINQLESLIQVNSSKLTMGRSIYLNFDRKQLQQKNLNQNFVNLMLCYESLLQKFITNQNACKNQLFNNGIKHFKGILRHLSDSLGASSSFLVNVNQYDMFVETLLYFNPLSMIHGNKHLDSKRIKNEVLQPILEANQKCKSFDRVKIWKVNILNMMSGQVFDVLLSLHDIVHYYESELPYTIDLDNEIKLPNLIEMLQDYFNLMVSHRSVVGRIILWRLPQYKKPIDKVTGRMINVQADELYRMQLLDIYKNMLKNVQSQLAFDDTNALPLSLDAEKKNPDKNKQTLPKLCLHCKSIREKQMPIFENNSQRVLKIVSQDMNVVVQRPKIFKSLKKLQYALITVIQHPSLECWVWQIYFPRNQRTFTCTLYASDLFSMDDEILNDDYILQAENVNQALWAHLINLSKLVKNPIGDIMLVIQNYKEPIKEILFQDIVYNQNAQDMMFMEVVIKNYANFVTDVERPFPAIHLKTDEIRQYTFAIRAFSLTRNIWIKDYQPFFEIIAMLKREKYYVNDLEYFYYTMLKDTACLLSHKIVFSNDAKTHEVKKRKLLYDIKSIINRKSIYREVSHSIEKVGSPKKEAKIEEYLDDVNKEVLKQESHEQSEFTKLAKMNNRPDWENVERLNSIIYQAIVSSNPVQMCTIIYMEIKDMFVYRLYRAKDSSIFERQISGHDVIRTCAPHLRSMLKMGLKNEVGLRIAQHYMANVLVASVLDFHKIR